MGRTTETGRVEWIIEDLTPEHARVLRTSDGEVQRIPRSLLGDEVEVGDVFRVVAQVERRASAPVSA